MTPKYPYIENFCDDSVYVFSTIGQGPKGEKGDRGDAILPIFSEPIEWDQNRDYEDLSVVMYQGDSYTSKKAVPAGVDIRNTNYWARTANFNAQLEQCRSDVAGVESGLAEEASRRALADEAIEQGVSQVADVLDEEVERLDGDVLSGRLPERQYVKATKVGKFSFDTSTYYAQGGCTDGEYIYQIITTISSAPEQHTLICKLSLDYELVDSIRVDARQTTPSVKLFHGNSLTYDADYHALYTYDLNGQFMVIDTDTFTIARETPQLSSTYDVLSCFQVENTLVDGDTTYANDRAIAQITGTNYYILYKRYGDKFVAWGGIEAPPTGIYNFRQDGTTYKNVFYHLLSGNYDGCRSMIRAISMGGTVAGDFVITNVKAEFESIFVLDDTFYLINAIGDVYTVPTTRKYNTGVFYYSLMSQYNVNPAVELFQQLPDDNVSIMKYFANTYEWAPYVANSATRYIAVRLPIPSAAMMQRRHLGMHATVFGQDFLGCQYKTNNDIHVLYHDYRNGNIGRIVWSRMVDDNFYRLANVMLYKNDTRTNRVLSIANTELEDMPTLIDKIDTWMKDSYQAGYTMCDIGNTWLQGYGRIRIRGNHMAAYGCIDLAKHVEGE